MDDFEFSSGGEPSLNEDNSPVGSPSQSLTNLMQSQQHRQQILDQLYR